MEKQIDLGNIKRVHFIGIGGISMSGLAEILVHNGYIVSGSDRTVSPATEHLVKAGIDVFIGCDAKNITSEIELVVYTAAIKSDNDELCAAQSKNIPAIVRAELLGALLHKYKYAVCIAGTHGKTSTTALITEIAQKCGLDPTVNIGGYINGKNYYIGSSEYFLLEACEYSNSFLHMKPYIGVILNIDEDHLDYHGSMDAIIDSFAAFARNIRPGGILVIQESVQGYDKITSGLKCRIVTFSTASDNENITIPSNCIAHYVAKNITMSKNGTPSFDIIKNASLLNNTNSTITESFQVRINLPQPGIYSMHNALAAYAVSHGLGMQPLEIAHALSQTKNAKRRGEFKGMFNNAKIVDDYAHHPTEIIACLTAARCSSPGRIICLFQPHTYTRTKNLFESFANSFVEADIVLFVPIYAAREAFDPSISSEMLAAKTSMTGKKAISFHNLREAETWLRGKLMPDDLLITMGAGDVYLVGDWLVNE